MLGGSVETKELRAPLVDACQAIDSVEVALQDLSPNLVGRHLQPSEADLALLADVFVGCVNGATEHMLEVRMHRSHGATQLFGDLPNAPPG